MRKLSEIAIDIIDIIENSTPGRKSSLKEKLGSHLSIMESYNFKDLTTKSNNPLTPSAFHVDGINIILTILTHSKELQGPKARQIKIELKGLLEPYKRR